MHCVLKCCAVSFAFFFTAGWAALLQGAMFSYICQAASAGTVLQNGSVFNTILTGNLHLWSVFFGARSTAFCCTRSLCVQMSVQSCSPSFSLSLVSLLTHKRGWVWGTIKGGCFYSTYLLALQGFAVVWRISTLANAVIFGNTAWMQLIVLRASNLSP